MDLLSDLLAVPEHDDIHAFRISGLIVSLFAWLIEEVIEHKRLSFGGSENKSLQSFNICSVDDASNFAEIALVHGLSEQLLLLSSSHLAVLDVLALDLLEALLDVGKHLLRVPEHLQAVNKVGQRLLCFLELGALSLDEGLLLGDFLLDLFEQQVERFLLAVTDDLELVQEVVDVFGRRDLDRVFFALCLQVLQQALRIFTRFDLCRVRKRIW